MNGLIKIALLTLVMASGRFLLAREHPVPLDPKMDSAKCLECHEDKTKGKNVHTAISMGCTSCHEIRVNKDITRVKLITATPASLCFSCHADKNPAQIKGTVHKPAVRDCFKCHDPHTSNNKDQLLKPASGDQKENLCLSCHEIGVHTPEKGSRHVALDMGCDTCHETHKTGPSPDREFTKHLKKATPALCLECHDAKDASLAKAHRNQPFDKADCVTCHNPHESDKPKLMQAFMHPPFADKQCDVCHEQPKNGKVVLTASGKDLCVMCHGDQAKAIETAKVQHPGAAMSDCTDCHNPHASRQPGLPKTNSVEICLSCHAEQAEMRNKKHLHQPAFEQGCATCHQPHGSENPKLLRAKSENDLCLECHGPDAQPKRIEAEHLITIFDGKVRLPEDYFRKVTVLPIKYGRGHPVEHHPVKDLMDADDNSKPRTSLGCGTCHQPHASAQPNLLVKDQSSNMQFCSTCHNDLGK
jgi:predicted CXXCH cytochrome family protein